mmetsp:Transcript_5520/g.13401  ORF Transcript_5520/g.13401 Transcript_5520/m.13401 type:complete len:238 (-) Transcript_5520:93-806(-)
MRLLGTEGTGRSTGRARAVRRAGCVTTQPLLLHGAASVGHGELAGYPDNRGSTLLAPFERRRHPLALLHVAVRKHEHALPRCRLAALEQPLVAARVLELPLAIDEIAILERAHEPARARVREVGSAPTLLPLVPRPLVPVPVGVLEGALSRTQPLLPHAIVGPGVGVLHDTLAMLLVGFILPIVHAATLALLQLLPHVGALALAVAVLDHAREGVPVRVGRLALAVRQALLIADTLP